MTARLLPRDHTGTVLDLRRRTAFEAEFGALPALPKAGHGRPGALIEEVERAGLRGRGGGWFPTAIKLRAVCASANECGRLSAGRHPVVIANAMEGEPAAHKDAALIGRNPHLVLDGIAAAVATVGARHAYIAVHRGSPLVATLDRAIVERSDAVTVEVVTPPARYVASEETALAHWTGHGIATPVFGERPFERGVRGRPTLILNAETMAHLALIARHGGDWFASVGDPAAPGTTLVSISGAVAHPGVLEVATGTPVRDIIERAGGLTEPVTGFLTGGYGGAWVTASDLLAAAWSPDGLRAIGGVLGAGILVAAGQGACPLAEIARVAQWMAGESAGQCGPCRFGLPSVADDLTALAGLRAGEHDLDQLQRRLALVTNRGGCKHPDGVARFVASGLRVFEAEVRMHLAGRCSGGSLPGGFATPDARTTPVGRPGKDLR